MLKKECDISQTVMSLHLDFVHVRLYHYTLISLHPEVTTVETTSSYFYFSLQMLLVSPIDEEESSMAQAGQGIGTRHGTRGT